MSDSQDSEAQSQALRLLVAGLFDARVSVGVAKIGATAQPLFAIEEAAIAAAVSARRDEFMAGRTAARAAMGIAVPVPVGDDRAPIWPSGIAGSISHAKGWAIAAVSRHWSRIGLDIECDAPLRSDMLDEILRPEERALPPHQTALVFSIKECVFKACYPEVRQFFEFDAVSVRLDDARGAFRATFQIDLPPFRRGDSLDGRYARGLGLVLSGVGG